MNYPSADHLPLPPAVPDYEMLRRVGTGAYGEIWLARSTATGVMRAVKIVWRDKFEHERPFQREFEGIQRFERISRGHPSQLALFHIGRNEAAGYFYYVMELADGLENPEAQIPDPSSDPTPTTKTDSSGSGSTVGSDSCQLYVPHTLRADLLQGRLPAGRVLEIGLALSEALSHLHSHGLVHRDVKPSNVIFVNGRPKLADIGLVTDVGDGRSIVGTEGYLPPEGPGTPQADIFALGKVLYEAATGQDRRQFPQLPSELRSWPDGHLVFELNEVLLKASAAAPQHRYKSADQVHADLALLKSGQSMKRLRTVERRLEILTKAGIAACLCAILGLGILYETNQRRKIAAIGLVRSHVEKGTRLMNEGDLFGALLSFTEALYLDRGNRQREECHRIRIASLLQECPKLVGVFTHDNAPINDAAFSPDSRRLVTAGDDDQALVWDLATGARLFALPHRGQVHSASFSPNGNLIATTSSDNLIHLWNASNGEPLAVSLMRHFATYARPHPCFSPQGDKLLTMQDLSTLRLWDVRTGSAVGKPLSHPQELSSFSFSPDGEWILTVSSDKLARVWSARTGDLATLFEHDGVVTCGAFSPDGAKLATGGEDNCVRFSELPWGKSLAPLEPFRHSVDWVAFSPEGTRLATACRDRTVELWDLAKRKTLIRPLEHDLKVFRVDFSPDGQWLATCSQGNRVRLWDSDTGLMRAPAFLHNTPRGPAAFSPDGHLLLTVRTDLTLRRDEVVVVWSLAKSEPPPLEIRPATTFIKVIKSPGERFKAVLSGQTVHTLVGETDQPMTQPLFQTAPVRQAFFSSDGTMLLTEDAGARGQAWDLTLGQPLTPRLRIHYNRTAPLPEKSLLPHDVRACEDLILLAELLSGARVDETGGFQPLDSSALVSAWYQLRGKPEFLQNFIDSGDDVLNWHAQEAQRCEQAWNWWSAVFHLNWLLKARPGDHDLAARLDYANRALAWANEKASGYWQRRCVVPPRNPSAKKQMVDLTSYYTPIKRFGEEPMAILPTGLQIFEHTEFDIRGVVQLGKPGAPPGQTDPGEVQAIRLNQRCHFLHFIHASALRTVEEAEVGRYVVHYVDHREKIIPILYGRHIRSWWTNENEPLTTGPATLIWMGANPHQSDGPRSLRLFKMDWENPWPETEVTTVDFYSGPNDGQPFLAALTAK